MIYVYVDGKRMAYLQNMLHAKSLTNEEELQKGDTLIFPVIPPAQRELPLKKGKLKLNKLEGYTLFLPFAYSFLKEANTVYYYMREETLVTKNAVLTAAGLISYLGEKQIDLFANHFDIIGYGRCGKAIAKVFSALGISHRIIQRSKSEPDFLDIEEYKKREKGNIILNTAPINYLKEEELNEKDTQYIIDISTEKVFSKKLQDKGIEICYPGSLPNRYLPYSAAKLIYEFVKGKQDEK